MRIIIHGKLTRLGNCKNNGDFTFLSSVYTFTFLLCGEQKTFTKNEKPITTTFTYLLTYSMEQNPS